LTVIVDIIGMELFVNQIPESSSVIQNQQQERFGIAKATIHKHGMDLPIFLLMITQQIIIQQQVQQVVDISVIADTLGMEIVVK